jgi:hypothetical protein
MGHFRASFSVITLLYHNGQYDQINVYNYVASLMKGRETVW